MRRRRGLRRAEQREGVHGAARERWRSRPGAVASRVSSRTTGRRSDLDVLFFESAMSPAACPKIALCSPAARLEAALLERHGYRVTASATATADVVMPARGGARAFVLHRAEALLRRPPRRAAATAAPARVYALVAADAHLVHAREPSTSSSRRALSRSAIESEREWSAARPTASSTPTSSTASSAGCTRPPSARGARARGKGAAARAAAGVERGAVRLVPRLSEPRAPGEERGRCGSRVCRQLRTKSNLHRARSRAACRPLARRRPRRRRRGRRGPRTTC